MARCKNCGHFGFFLKLNQEGLCEECAPVIDNIIINCARIMKESLNCLNRADDFNTKLTYCNQLFENAVRLEEYEKKGIHTIKPRPSIFIDECNKIKKELHLNTLSQEKIS
ncbi:MAG: hypothetical protein ACQEP5_06895 [Actinomycetota bacterium]